MSDPVFGFGAKLDGEVIRVSLECQEHVDGAILCFSCMAPVWVVEGGDLLRQDGGYTEVALPALAPNVPHELVLRHDGFRPANRAWLPLGAFIRLNGRTISLPRLPAGAAPWRGGDDAFDGLRVIPQPSRASLDGGKTACDGVATDDPVFCRIDELARRNGLKPLIGSSRLEIEDDAEVPAEGYALSIASDTIKVRVADDAGRRNAAVTLLWLINLHEGRLPTGGIEDAPRFSWRGQHLDCARHFYDVETILSLLDLMALLKLNRFHWHFADDEAFRVELPGLTDLAKTAWRGEGELLPGVFGGGVRAGGLYSVDDVRRIIHHATDLQIEVMPEIECPAHALCLARLYPDTRDPDDTGAETSVQGYAGNILNPATDAAWDLWHAIMHDVAQMFPGDMLHLGCDELPDGAWSGSAAIDTLKSKEGLETPEGVREWTIRRLANATRASGKRPAAWEEAAIGADGIGHGALLFSWTGQGPGIDAARAGYDVVMCPAQNVYLDMASTDDPSDWGANWAAYISLADTIAWDPVPNDATDVADRIVGVQGAFWSEFTTEDHEMWPMVFPRILGVAMQAWQPQGSADIETLSRIASHAQSAMQGAPWVR